MQRRAFYEKLRLRFDVLPVTEDAAMAGVAAARRVGGAKAPDVMIAGVALERGLGVLTASMGRVSTPGRGRMAGAGRPCVSWPDYRPRGLASFSRSGRDASHLLVLEPVALFREVIAMTMIRRFAALPGEPVSRSHPPSGSWPAGSAATLLLVVLLLGCPGCGGGGGPNEQDPEIADSDGDGIADIVEIAAGTDPNDPADDPRANGDFVFVAGQDEPPAPASDVLHYTTSDSLGGTIDVTVALWDDPTDAVDAIDAFIDRVDPDTAAGAPCASTLVVIDYDGDGVNDTFRHVGASTELCFGVAPRTNTTVPSGSVPVVHKATIQIWGDHVTLLDARGIYILVP